MALQIALDSALTNIVSSSNPITSSHPISGSSVEIQLWLFNDNTEATAKYYTGITVDPTDTTNTDESTWIQLAPDSSGVAGTYLAGSAALTMSDIGASGSVDTAGHLFWCKITTPSVTDSQNKTDIQLSVAATEYAV